MAAMSGTMQIYRRFREVLGLASGRHEVRVAAPYDGELKPLEDLNASPKIKSPALVSQAVQFATEGWTRWGHSLPHLNPPVPWYGDRGSFDYALNAWEPLTTIIPAYEYSGDELLYKVIVDFVEDWLNGVQKPQLTNAEASIDALLAAPQTGQWYDMAVGQRIYRLAYVLDLLMHRDAGRTELIETLAASLDFHHRLLARDSFFAANSNHGIYQALGQLAAARRFESRFDHGKYAVLAEKRLIRLVGDHFFDSGVHKEHSPIYHYMVLGSLTGALSSDMIRSPFLSDLIVRMEDVLGWMLQPDMYLTPFGDSDPRLLNPGLSAAERMTSKALQYLFSGGAIGEPQFGVKAYHDAGYAFAKLFAPDADRSNIASASYLAQIAGFHSRVHKHADHLAFVWHDLRRDILIDPARYAYEGSTECGSDLNKHGFRYSDPKRIHVEPTRAHNCVEIDGQSYRRTNRDAFGSALRYGGEQHGLAVTDCELTHQRTVQHRRVLVMVPQRALLVLDWLNDRKHEHIYRQWFTFHPSWQVERRNDCLLAADAGDNTQAAAQLLMCNLIDGNVVADPVRGREEPDLLGWTSDAAYSLVPASSTCVEAPRSGRGRFATIFLLDGNAVVDTATSRFNETLRRGRVLWSDAQGKHQLSIELGAPGQVAVSLEDIG
jgi:hypothetical protein